MRTSNPLRTKYYQRANAGLSTAVKIGFLGFNLLTFVNANPKKYLSTGRTHLQELVHIKISDIEPVLQTKSKLSNSHLVTLKSQISMLFNPLLLTKTSSKNNLKSKTIQKNHHDHFRIHSQKNSSLSQHINTPITKKPKLSHSEYCLLAFDCGEEPNVNLYKHLQNTPNSGIFIYEKVIEYYIKVGNTKIAESLFAQLLKTHPELPSQDAYIGLCIIMFKGSFKDYRLRKYVDLLMENGISFTKVLPFIIDSIPKDVSFTHLLKLINHLAGILKQKKSCPSNLLALKLLLLQFQQLSKRSLIACDTPVESAAKIDPTSLTSCITITSILILENATFPLLDVIHQIPTEPILIDTTENQMNETVCNSADSSLQSGICYDFYNRITLNRIIFSLTSKDIRMLPQFIDIYFSRLSKSFLSSKQMSDHINTLISAFIYEGQWMFVHSILLQMQKSSGLFRINKFTFTTILQSLKSTISDSSQVKSILISILDQSIWLNTRPEWLVSLLDGLEYTGEYSLLQDFFGILVENEHNRQIGQLYVCYGKYLRKNGKHLELQNLIELGLKNGIETDCINQLSIQQLGAISLRKGTRKSLEHFKSSLSVNIDSVAALMAVLYENHNYDQVELVFNEWTVKKPANTRMFETLIKVLLHRTQFCTTRTQPGLASKLQFIISLLGKYRIERTTGLETDILKIRKNLGEIACFHDYLKRIKQTRNTKELNFGIETWIVLFEWALESDRTHLWTIWQAGISSHSSSPWISSQTLLVLDDQLRNKNPMKTLVVLKYINRQCISLPHYYIRSIRTCLGYVPKDIVFKSSQSDALDEDSDGASSVETLCETESAKI
ncbi:hypothetical protein BC833DRAFT_599950 [Globomyces pollinis-pini]|nr:hypothetical protein BC833DRAFT_599950 [Globomyces pollinis-pini]